MQAGFASPRVEPQPEEAETKQFSKLLFVEIFCGTGGLTANIKALGVQGIGIDSSVSTACKSPVLKLDLTKKSGQQILWEVLNRPNTCGVHLAPPCGTESRARDIPREYGPSPLPLRSETHPDGLPSLRGLDLKRVRSANCLYRLTGDVLKFCIDRNIPCSVENPARSHFWATRSFTDPIKDVLNKLEETYFHHCMYGSKRRKHTKFFFWGVLLVLLCLFSRCAPYAPSYISYDDSSHSEWALDFLLGRSTTGVACLIPS